MEKLTLSAITAFSSNPDKRRPMWALPSRLVNWIGGSHAHRDLTGLEVLERETDRIRLRSRHWLM